MFKLRILTICLFVFLFAGCKNKEQGRKPDVINPPADAIEGDEKDLTSQVEKNTIRIKFNPKYLPDSYVAVEMVFAGQYQGYFDVTDYIYLPKISGRQRIMATFSGMDGYDIATKIYYIEVK